jgi:hypothetical protein
MKNLLSAFNFGIILVVLGCLDLFLTITDKPDKRLLIIYFWGDTWAYVYIGIIILIGILLIVFNWKNK